MVKARKYIVTKYFQGYPKVDDMEIKEFELPPIKDKEILVKVEWLSIDPYQRAYNHNQALPYDQFGYQIGIVQESKNEDYPVGSRVVSHSGWCDYCILDPFEKVENPGFKIYKLPDLKSLPISYGIGIAGMPGATAYFGLLEICKPQPGETIVVTGAAGAVGSIVGQIAKIKGCRVIGFAGSDDKVKWLENELCIDKAINYKTADVSAALKDAAPNGIDCYFDNVGGEISSQIIHQMNSYGRVAVCGSISTYNEDPQKLPKATILQPVLVFKKITVRGFMVFEWAEQWPEAFKELVGWIKAGQLKARETITDGFDGAFDAFVGMLHGDNYGKTLVKL